MSIVDVGRCSFLKVSCSEKMKAQGEELTPAWPSRPVAAARGLPAPPDFQPSSSSTKFLIFDGLQLLERPRAREGLSDVRLRIEV